MIHTGKNSNSIARGLLEIGAIKLSIQNPYKWASGWNSPIYCDNRMTLSHSELRTAILNAFLDLIEEKGLEADCIAGVATGGIPYGALVADKLNLPFVYVRSKIKEHGRKNLVEGDLKKGWKTLVIEDLISTGGSSMQAVVGLRDAGAKVESVLSIFTYAFDQATSLFANGDCEYMSLVKYEDMVDQASRLDYIKEEEKMELQNWRKNPSVWKNK